MNYYRDIDDPQQFYANSPKAREFYRLRDEDELPSKPCGYENCYHVADTFTDFIRALAPLNDDE